MDNIDDKIRAAVERILALLVAKDYGAVVAATKGVRLSEQEIHDAVQAYGRELVSGHARQLEAMDVIEVLRSKPRRWSVNVPFWTREEGRSDLTLEVTVVDEGKALGIEIDDIHVL